MPVTSRSVAFCSACTLEAPSTLIVLCSPMMTRAIGTPMEGSSEYAWT